MEEDPRDIVRGLAELAGLPMTRERIAALALAMPMIEATVRILAAVEYGDVEPAGGFRPPQGSQR